MDQLRLNELTPDLEPLSAGRGPVPVRPPHRKEIVGGKGSIFYRAHSYHTKVPPEGIAEAVEHYTDPGAIVVDPFCGSGMTGVACLLTGRRAVLSDLSPAAVHITRNYVAHVDPDQFEGAGRRLLHDLSDLEQMLYGTHCNTCEGRARIEYTVWSDVHLCAACDAELVFWESGLNGDRTAVGRTITCSACSAEWRKKDLGWTRTTPVQVSVSCTTCRSREQRILTDDEFAHAVGFTQDVVPYWYPTDPFDSWREMWRGQHAAQGLATAADFYTPRNLWALAAVWERIASSHLPDAQSALSFAFTSIVNRASRRYQWNPKRPTNVLSSTMYVASLSYEFNVFSLLRRKLKTIRDLYRATTTLPGSAEVHQAPAQQLGHIPDGSVDYVFTDPPFGSNIFYGDSSFLWEAWLQESTDPKLETVVNRSLDPEHGGKDVADYEKLMASAFEEMARILRHGAWASVMFHNSNDEVWSALQRAVEAAGFEVASAVAFDKSQPSFKGVKTLLDGERVPAFDLVLHLRSHGGTPTRTGSVAAKEMVIVAALRDHLATATPSKRTTPYLHSLVMRILLEAGLALEGWTYKAVEDLCQAHFSWTGGQWELRPPSPSEPKK
ncbi:MAG: DNA methyltransferase [Acidimicrobiia bacterium]